MSQRPMSVLVVDDNADLADNLGELLELGGADVTVTYSAEAALDVLERRAFGLVVTDMRMPGMSGLDLLRRVREAQPGVSVLIVTAYAQDAQLDQARAAGALDILAKPVDLERFNELCERALALAAPVLVVDDDDHLRPNIVEMLLQLPGVVPFAARSVEQARRIEASVPVRAAVLDLKLPGESGAELGKQLGKRGSAVPAIVYISGYVDELSQVEASARVLQKPFDSSQLLTFLREAL